MFAAGLAALQILVLVNRMQPPADVFLQLPEILR